MGKGKSDPGSLIGLGIGLLVLIFGMLDFPAGKISDKVKGPDIFQTVLSQPFGTWDEKWGKKLILQQEKKDNFAGYLVGFNSFLDFKSFFLVVGGVLAATFVALPLASFGSVFAVGKVIFRSETYDYVGTINSICERASKAEKKGYFLLKKI